MFGSKGLMFDACFGVRQPRHMAVKVSAALAVALGV